MVVGEMWKIRFAWLLNSQVAYGVWHFRVSALTSAGLTDTEVADNMEGLMRVAAGALVTNPATFQGVGAQYIGPNAVRLEKQDSNPLGGSRGDNPLPQQVAGLAKLTTGFAGRAQRGYKYFPFPDEDDNDGAILEGPNAAYRTAVDAFMGLLIPSIVLSGAGGNATFVPVLDTVYRASPSSVTAWTTYTRWSQQKRRSRLRRADAGFPTVA